MAKTKKKGEKNPKKKKPNKNQLGLLTEQLEGLKEELKSEVKKELKKNKPKSDEQKKPKKPKKQKKPRKNKPPEASLAAWDGQIVVGPEIPMPRSGPAPIDQIQGYGRQRRVPGYYYTKPYIRGDGKKVNSHFQYWENPWDIQTKPKKRKKARRGAGGRFVGRRNPGLPIALPNKDQAIAAAKVAGAGVGGFAAGQLLSTVISRHGGQALGQYGDLIGPGAALVGALVIAPKIPFLAPMRGALVAGTGASLGVSALIRWASPRIRELFGLSGGASVPAPALPAPLSAPTSSNGELSGYRSGYNALESAMADRDDDLIPRGRVYDDDLIPRGRVYDDDPDELDDEVEEVLAGIDDLNYESEGLDLDIDDELDDELLTELDAEGFEDLDDDEALSGLGELGFVVKPNSLAPMREHVRSAISQRRTSRASRITQKPGGREVIKNVVGNMRTDRSGRRVMPSSGRDMAKLSQAVRQSMGVNKPTTQFKRDFSSAVSALDKSERVRPAPRPVVRPDATERILRSVAQLAKPPMSEAPKPPVSEAPKPPRPVLVARKPEMGLKPPTLPSRGARRKRSITDRKGIFGNHWMEIKD